MRTPLRIVRWGRAAPAAHRPSPEPIEVTARDGSLTHHVSDQQMAAAAEGLPQGLCGSTFVPAALTVPPGPLCPRCAAAYERGMPRD
jgi:hypothetical protein